MKIIRQDQFNEFCCIAQKCPESCCKFWQIYADEDALRRYEELNASDERIRELVDFKDGSFRQKDGICGFLDPDELCYLQKTYGEGMLCDTCGNYPRHVEEYENVREYSLSLSCPQAAKMLLLNEQPMRFNETQDDEEEEYEDFDYLLYDALLDVRDLLYGIAQCRQQSIGSRLGILSEFASEYQDLLEDGGLFDTDGILEKYRDLTLQESAAGSSFNWNFEKNDLDILLSLEHMHKDWGEKLKRTADRFSGAGPNDQVGFEAFINDNGTAAEQILMLFLYTYFCGAVYDGWVSTKILLSVFSVKWIFCIAYAQGGTKEDLLQSAWQYAREIEHSDLNLDKMEEWLTGTE